MADCDSVEDACNVGDTDIGEHFSAECRKNILVEDSSILWDRLTHFVGDGRIPLDNRVERALRVPVFGRKTYFCSRSERGAKTAVVLYSLVETARLNGLDPARYLLDATRAAIKKPDTVTLP